MKSKNENKIDNDEKISSNDLSKLFDPLLFVKLFFFLFFFFIN